MIRYNGLAQPCFGQRQAPPRCANFAAVRAESSHALLHLCFACRVSMGGAGWEGWTFTPLTGDDALDASPMDPVGLMMDAPWIFEIDGVKREDVIS